MADEAPKKTLAETHPETGERHRRIRELTQAVIEARRGPPDAIAALAAEAAPLLAWAAALAQEIGGDPEAFRARSDRDRVSFAHALRLSGDEQVVAQVLAACADLRSAIG
jgi:hypothetical protein